VAAAFVVLMVVSRWLMCLIFWVYFNVFIFLGKRLWLGGREESGFSLGNGEGRGVVFITVDGFGLWINYTLIPIDIHIFHIGSYNLKYTY